MWGSVCLLEPFLDKTGPASTAAGLSKTLPREVSKARRRDGGSEWVSRARGEQSLLRPGQGGRAVAGSSPYTLAPVSCQQQPGPPRRVPGRSWSPPRKGDVATRYPMSPSVPAHGLCRRKPSQATKCGPRGPTNAHALWFRQSGDAGEPRAAFSVHLGTGGAALGLPDILQPSPQHALGGGGPGVQPPPPDTIWQHTPSPRCGTDSDPNPAGSWEPPVLVPDPLGLCPPLLCSLRQLTPPL